MPLAATVLTVAVAVAVAGCRDDTATIRQLQAERQAAMQSQTRQDHLGETTSLLSRLVDLNPERARQQIVYHLNQWRETRSGDTAASEQWVAPPAMLESLSGVLPTARIGEAISDPAFRTTDVSHLRDAYLFRQIVGWADSPEGDDPVLRSWFADLGEELPADSVDRLRTATRLFDWTVRNVAFEPADVSAPPIDIPRLPMGMKFQGPGYRQTDYQTVWRGVGDGLQRAGVFTQLCRQTGITAALLATQSQQTGKLSPWAVGVLVGEDVYLFEPRLGTFVPGPGGVGVATLAQARTDEVVMRRLGVPGFFDYPLGKSDVQQCVALLNVVPEALSPRMRQLEEGLTGDRRMKVYVDAAARGERLDAVSGIADVRLWEVPVLAEIYRGAIEQAASRDPRLAFWYYSRWAILESELEMAKELARGRWRHLQGRFSDDEIEDESGARTLYLAQRAPEFEIADLRIDVELQKQYGIRRELGTDPDEYDQQVQRIQALMRLGKRTATYWLSLVQYDAARYAVAENWFRKRVLDQSQQSFWVPAARYNLGRTLEQLGQFEEAIEIYKTDDDPQEHGNRIRARLIDRLAENG